MFKPYKSQSFFDEMLHQNGSTKAHYQAFRDMMNQFTGEELREKHETAQLSFLRQGITFTVYNDNIGTERTMPFDFIPIIVPPDAWSMIEKGMKQRVEALN